MVRFEPPEFREDVLNALNEWDNVGWGVPDGLVPVDEWDIPNEEGEKDLIITPETSIEASLQESHKSYPMRCKQFVELMHDAKTAAFVDRRECRTKTRVLVRVVQKNERAISFLNNAVPEAESDEDLILRNELIEKKSEVACIDKRLESCLRGNLDDESKKLEKARFAANNAVRELEARFNTKPAKRFLPINVSSDGLNINVCLTTGLTFFGVVGTDLGCYDEEYGPLPDDEVFVDLRFQQAPTDEQISNIVRAYLFELAASLKAEFEIQALPVIDYMEDNPAFVQAIHQGVRLRPLMIGKGMNEVLGLCACALTASDSEFRILYATKVIEYVAQTVIRKEAFEKIRAKLLSARALSPDATFISELQGIVSKGEKTEANDGEAIRQTVLCCCDATDLARVAPPYLKEFQSKNLASDLKIRETALGKFARALYAARNSIAHAKANYRATGHECPAEDLAALADCALHAAQQVVRWFHSTPEDIRVVS